MDFGKRLREERARLGLSQQAFAELGGVKRVSQLLYEQGDRVPDVLYLDNLKKHGVDVPYLLFGQRSIGATGNRQLVFSPQLLTDIYDVVEEFARDEYGEPLPAKEKRRLFEFLCAALSGSTESHDTEELRTRLASLASGR